MSRESVLFLFLVDFGGRFAGTGTERRAGKFDEHRSALGPFRPCLTNLSRRLA